MKVDERFGLFYISLFAKFLHFASQSLAVGYRSLSRNGPECNGLGATD